MNNGAGNSGGGGSGFQDVLVRREIIKLTIFKNKASFFMFKIRKTNLYRLFS